MNKPDTRNIPVAKQGTVGLHATARRPFEKWALGLGLVGFAALGSAVAAEGAAGQALDNRFAAAQVFTFLFLMLGPFKIIGPFLKVTRGADATLKRRIAVRSAAFASLALVLAGFLGSTFLSSYGIPLPILALAGGIILFLVALQTTLAQFALEEAHDEQAAGPAATPTMKEALMPLAFPTIVTPYGIAALVVFLGFAADLQAQVVIGAIVVAIMLLNLVTMLIAERFLPVLSVLLPILGAVLGVVQVALGLLIIHNSLKALGIL
jgi:multiple antibiotic resistance protein